MSFIWGHVRAGLATVLTAKTACLCIGSHYCCSLFDVTRAWWRHCRQGCAKSELWSVAAQGDGENTGRNKQDSPATQEIYYSVFNNIIITFQFLWILQSLSSLKCEQWQLSTQVLCRIQHFYAQCTNARYCVVKYIVVNNNCVKCLVSWQVHSVDYTLSSTFC